jgi:hypothetical protein
MTRALLATILLSTSLTHHFVKANELELIQGQVEPLVVKDSVNEDGFTLTARDGTELYFSNSPKTEEAKQVFESMTPEMQKEFLESRKTILNFTAKVLKFGKLKYGLGQIIKNKITQIVSKVRRNGNPLDHLINDAQTANGLPQTDSLSVNHTKAKHELGKGVLNQIDQQLWLAAPVVASQNEFTISAWLGVILEAGGRHRGVGGSLGFGLNIGYNKDSKAFVFEIFQDIDSYEKGITGVLLAGLTPKIGINLINQKAGEEMKSRTGQSLYPPVAPLFSSKYSDMAVIGLSSALLSFPPLIGDGMAYVNTSDRRTLLRVTVSPVMKGFLRFKVAPPDITPLVRGIKNLKSVGANIRSAWESRDKTPILQRVSDFAYDIKIMTRVLARNPASKSSISCETLLATSHY